MGRGEEAEGIDKEGCCCWVDDATLDDDVDDEEPVDEVVEWVDDDDAGPCDICISMAAAAADASTAEG